MSIFQMKNNEPYITPEGVVVPEFRQVWERDTHENKSTAQKELAYIYHMGDPKSIYAELPDRELNVRRDYLGEDNEPDEIILTAIEKYKDMKETPSLRALRSCEALLVKMSNFFDNVNLEETYTDLKTGKVVYVHDIGKITTALSKFEGVVSTIRKLKKEVEKEAEAVSEKRRGDVEVSILDED